MAHKDNDPLAWTDAAGASVSIGDKALADTGAEDTQARAAAIVTI